jgi:hypothetical protein
MFKPGDKIVFINTSKKYDDDFKHQDDEYLKKYETYIIRRTFSKHPDMILIENKYGAYNIERFVSLKEYRKKKLTKISEKNNIEH